MKYFTFSSYISSPCINCSFILFEDIGNLVAWHSVWKKLRGLLVFFEWSVFSEQIGKTCFWKSMFASIAIKHLSLYIVIFCCICSVFRYFIIAYISPNGPFWGYTRRDVLVIWKAVYHLPGGWREALLQRWTLIREPEAYLLREKGEFERKEWLGNRNAGAES